MSAQNAFERIMASYNDAMIDDTRWPAAGWARTVRRPRAVDGDSRRAGPHRARRTAAGLAVLLVLSAGSSSMAQGRRVALVVGNDAYQAQGVLRNAVKRRAGGGGGAGRGGPLWW